MADPETTPTDPEVLRLMRVIERDRSRVADALGKIRSTIGARAWMACSRGSYQYDDARYQTEFAGALDEIAAACEGLKKVAGDLTDSPKGWADIQEARANG
jgi:hypothetical protein